MHFSTILLPLLATTALAIPSHLKPRCTPCEIEELAEGVLGGAGEIVGGLGGIFGGGGSTQVSSSSSVSSGSTSECQPCEAAHQGARMLARGLGLEERFEGVLYPSRK